MNKTLTGEQKEELFHKVGEQFGNLHNLTPPMQVWGLQSIAWQILFESDRDVNDTALVYLHVENEIGIAHRDIRGYTPTPAIISDDVNGSEAVDWFNENILGHSHIEAAKIVLSTMRG